MAHLGSRVNGPLGRLAAQRKKSALAFTLIAVMAIMWIRVLTGDKPDAAEAAVQQNDSGNQSSSSVRVLFVELPKVSGRNDVISRDFFASNGWMSFAKNIEGQNVTDKEEVGVISTGDNEEVVFQVKKNLKLEAIVMGEDRRALINNKLVSVGDKLSIRDGTDKYESEVLAIGEGTVLVEVGKTRITLKMADIDETN
ncbi:MAG: hypothetical protein JSU70_10425 [Phycisphaerales bacterium]|nr:MAG: hypothetical protein JSU70_10425 [Phycisphaerales bacterium]